MEFLFGILVGFVLATIHFLVTLRRIIENALSEVSDEDSESGKDTLSVKVEHHEGQFLLYSADDDRFLLQGTCMDDFVKYAKARSDVDIKIINGASEAAKALLATRKAK